MNRPFQAFGTLLMLLAAAMLAVNSGSRTTMFDRPSPSVTGSLPPRSSRLGNVYVVVLPAGESIAVSEAMPDLIGLLDDCWAGEDLPSTEDRTLYDPEYDRAVYGDVVPPAPPDLAAVSITASRTSVRSGHWLLHFAASSLNHMGRACEAMASRLETLGSEPVAATPELPPR